MSLQEAAEARKAKLAALKKRKTLHDSAAPADDAHQQPDPTAERSALSCAGSRLIPQD